MMNCSIVTPRRSAEPRRSQGCRSDSGTYFTSTPTPVRTTAT
jgi:hypothetical protein